MGQVLITLAEVVGAALQSLPELIAAIRASNELTLEQKQAALNRLQGELEATGAKVAAVKFLDV